MFAEIIKILDSSKKTKCTRISVLSIIENNKVWDGDKHFTIRIFLVKTSTVQMYQFNIGSVVQLMNSYSVRTCVILAQKSLWCWTLVWNVQDIIVLQYRID